MSNFSRLTLATLLMGSLALPALALDSVSPKEATQKDVSRVTTAAPVAPKVASSQVHATSAPHAAGKPGLHKAAANSEIPGTVAKPVTTPSTTSTTGTSTTGALPSKDAKAKDAPKDATGVMGKDASKDAAPKIPAPAPVTKSN